MKQKSNKQVESFEQKQVKKRSDEAKKLHEIHKAVAQAWHSHFNNARIATCEFDVRRRNFKGMASRFRLEAMNKLTRNKEDAGKKVDWHFNESLWDSYEIVAVSKRLETGLILGYESCDLQKIGENNRVLRKRKESKNSLRNLFNVMSSRRFNDADVSHDQESY